MKYIIPFLLICIKISLAAAQPYLILVPVLLILMKVGIAFAQPFLVCHPQENASKYEVWFDGEIYEVAAEGDGSVKWDLHDIELGQHEVRLRAGNIYGDWSDWSDPFFFIRAIMTPPSGIGLSTR